MELYFQFIFLLAFAKYALKASMAPKGWILLLYPLVAAVVAYAIYPFMIQQRGDSFTAILSDKGLVMDCAVLITVEAVLGILSSVYILDNYFAPKEKRRKSIFVLKVMPGILFFIGIAYFELAFFRQFVGMPFGRVALIYSGVIFAVVTLLAYLFRYMLRGESIKLEAKITFNMLILVIGLLINASLADYNTSHSQNRVDWAPTVVTILLLAVLAAVGFIVYPYRYKIREFFRPGRIKNNE